MDNNGRVIVFAPLLNFECKGTDTIELSEDLSIVRSMPDEITEYMNLYPEKVRRQFVKQQDIEELQRHFKVRCQVQTDMLHSMITFSETRVIFRDLTNALILFKQGEPVFLGPCYMVGRGFGQGTESIFRDIRRRPAPRRYRMKAGETSQFPEWWEKFRLVLGQNQYFKRALGRLSSIIHSFHPADYRLIDSLIGLECIFSEGQGDLRYKVSQRVAFFIGRRKRREVYRRMKKAYNLRNNIIHSGIGDLKQITCSRRDTTEYLRKSLKNFVKKTLLLRGRKDKEQFLEDLDMRPR